ncbi:MAG: hypothetical protein ACI8W7_003629, partial [Gammaproteobacteria bacterium]
MLRTGIDPRSETGSRYAIDLGRCNSGAAPATVGERKQSHLATARGVNNDVKRGKADRLGRARTARPPARKPGDRPVSGDVVSREATANAVASAVGAGRPAACSTTTMAIALTPLSTFRHDCSVTPRGVARIEKASQAMIVVSNRTKSPRPYELPISVCAAVSERVGLQQGFDDNLSPDVERANREGDAAFARSFGGFAAGSAINMRDRQLIELAPRLVGVWDTNADEVLLSAGLGLARSDYALR